MECEHGPRKKTNALKRMLSNSQDKEALKNIVNLTCPARLFVKKVRKFPEYQVDPNTDPKILRTQQEQALKQLRTSGMETQGEVRYQWIIISSLFHLSITFIKWIFELYGAGFCFRLFDVAEC